MDRLIERLSDTLATGSSRRGFLRTFGKVALAGGALLAGVGVTAVEAQGSECCGSAPQCDYGSNNACAPWNCLGADYCCKSGGYYYTCAPCYYCGTTTITCYEVAGPTGLCEYGPS